MARLLVCGGRDFNDRRALFAWLDSWHAIREVTLLMHGAQRGADMLADEWARSRGIPVQPFHANWKLLGNRAGSARNARMLREGRPDAVLAFPGGPGTRDMVRKALAAGTPTWRLEPVDGPGALVLRRVGIISQR